MYLYSLIYCLIFQYLSSAVYPKLKNKKAKKQKNQNTVNPTELKSPYDFKKSWNTSGLAKIHNESCDRKGQGIGAMEHLTHIDLQLPIPVMNKQHHLDLWTAATHLNELNAPSWILFGQWHRKTADPPGTEHWGPGMTQELFIARAWEEEKAKQAQLPVSAQPLPSPAGCLDSWFKCRLVLLQFLFLS